MNNHKAHSDRSDTASDSNRSSKQTYKDTAYDLLSNAAGDLVLILGGQEREPDNSARLVYDGGSDAILYRNHDSALEIQSIAKEARGILLKAQEITIVEPTEDDMSFQYKVPIYVVKNLASLKE